MTGGALTELSSARAADFVSRFASFWRGPDPEHLASILTQDVRLAQPLSPPTLGLAEAQASFRRLFAALPDLRASVERWRGDDSVVFIEFRLHATLGRRRIEWPAVDRFTLRGDLACERISYFDGVPLALRLARHPLTALRALRR
jgi:hypothetical protein